MRPLLGTCYLVLATCYFLLSTDLQHVSVLDHVVLAHLLAVVSVRAPDSGVVERCRQVAMDEACDIADDAARPPAHFHACFRSNNEPATRCTD